MTRAGEEIWLQEALSAPTFHLLLCGPADVWDLESVDDLRTRNEGLLTIHRLVPGHTVDSAEGAYLADVSGQALNRLRARPCAQVLVRPDGHIGYRAEHPDLAGAGTYLTRWLTDMARPPF